MWLLYSKLIMFEKSFKKFIKRASRIFFFFFFFLRNMVPMFCKFFSEYGGKAEMHSILSVHKENSSSVKY